VWFRSQPAAVAEVEAPPLTPDEELAAIEREFLEAEDRFNLALQRQRQHFIEGDRFAQDVRTTYERRNIALRKRADLRLKYASDK
jgi:hypothetical protein